MLRPLFLACTITLTLAACGERAPSAPLMSPSEHTNPLLAPAQLPFAAPPFDRISDADYQHAIEQGMREHLQEVEQIAHSPDAPTFANTIEALERSGSVLTRASNVFFAMTSAHTNPALQAAEEALAPKLAAHSDEIHLNPALFARIEAIYTQRATLGLTPEQITLVEHYQRNFERAGARLSATEQAELRQINGELSTLSTAFSSKLLAANNAGGVHVTDPTQLAGLDEAQIAAAADAAKAAGIAGAWLLPLQNTSQQPILASLNNPALREEVMHASLTRAERGDANDTRESIQRLAQLRARKAQLLGFANYAAWQIADQMAATPETARKLLTDTLPAAAARARIEQANIEAVSAAQHGSFTPGPTAAAHWDFYAEYVRKAEFDLDEAQIKPYFELDRVLKDGVFFAANQLYGITVTERTDLPVYHPDVRVFDINDADGSQIALFYFDPFKRESKQGGAWMGNFVEQNGLTGAIPVVYNVENFSKPAAGQPALLSFDDVTTLFHEFGHALHGFFSNTRYPSLAGTNVPRDFVEFPSQFNEHWALYPAVLTNYAKHWQTGEAMPQALIDKIITARTFNQGYATTEYLQAALLDLAWHTLPASAPQQDVDDFEARTLAALQINLPAIPPRYRSSYFSHIWGGGYAAGYYAYFASEVLDHDAFAWFVEHGGMSRENGQIFRKKILSIGHTRDLAAAYREFRGHDPSVEPLLIHRGLK